MLKTKESKEIAKEITFKREGYLKKGIGQFYEDLIEDNNHLKDLIEASV